MGWRPTVSDTDCFFPSAFCSWGWITSVNLCSSSLILLPAQILSLWIFHFSHCTFQILEFLFDSFEKFRSLYSLKKKKNLFWLHCTAHGILVSQPGIEPTPPALATESLNHWTREVTNVFINTLFEESLAKGRIFPLVLWIHWKRNCFFCY